MYIYCTSIMRWSREETYYFATGPDGISPRLLGAAGTSFAVLLIMTNLYLRSLREAKVYDDWRVARLDPIFEKDDESDRGKYRELSMLSVPSKILESCVTDSTVDHVFTRKQLVTESHWAYRKSHSTDLLLAHLSSSFRPGTKGSTYGNDLLTITQAKMMVLNQNLAHIKNSSSLTLSSINIVLISYLICLATILLKIVNYWPIGRRFKKRNRATTYFKFILNISNTSRLEWPSIALQ